MKRRITLLFFTFLFLLSHTSYAKQISSDNAKYLALKTISKKTKTTGTQQLKLVYTAQATLNEKSRSQRSVNLYYVFNIGDNNGFIITSADDINVPVIGHSDQGEYDIENLPENYREWMKSIEDGMIKRISEGVEPSDYVKRKWSEYNSSTKSQATIQGVSPLLSTKWDQTRPYYNMTPVYNSVRTYTGCVATAMAQIMKFHEHPKTIEGSVSIPAYTSSTLGINIDGVTLTSNPFDWGNMTDTYNYYSGTTPTEVQENAVAKLMYYCGISVSMNYNTIGTSGSGAATINAAKALMNYFNYDKDIAYKGRTGTYNYTDQEWTDMIKAEINQGRALIYSGTSPARGGHAFICDGYNDNDEFHFNWGWSGYQDGYYNINAPLDFTEAHRAMVNIKPNEGGIGIAEFFVNSYSNYPESVKREEPFRLDCSVRDISIHSMSTEYDIAIYDADDNFVSIINFVSYTSGYNTSATRCKVPVTVAPGTYKIKAVLKQEDNTYLPITKSSSLQSEPTLIVEEKLMMHNLDIRDKTAFTTNITSGKEGDLLTATLSFGNKGGYEFKGSWGIALVDKNNLNIKYVLTQEDNKSLNIGYLYPTYSFYCYLPANMVSGNYKLMMCAKGTDKKWDVVCGANETIVDFIDFTVNGTTTGIDETKSDKISIYPNPVIDILHIATNNHVLQALIYDANGKLLIEQTNSNTVDVHNLNKGIYILKVETDSGTSVHKINKQ